MNLPTLKGKGYLVNLTSFCLHTGTLTKTKLKPSWHMLRVGRKGEIRLCQLGKDSTSWGRCVILQLLREHHEINRVKRIKAKEQSPFSLKILKESLWVLLFKYSEQIFNFFLNTLQNILLHTINRLCLQTLQQIWAFHKQATFFLHK